ncbi:MAG TPA: hypothetical protein VGM07_06045 [Stellaceae bacterium]
MRLGLARAGAALEVIAVHAVLDFEMADDRREAVGRFIPRRIGPVPRRTGPVIQTRNLGAGFAAATAFVAVDATGLDPGQRFALGTRWTQGVAQGVAVERVAVPRFGPQHKPAAPRFREGGLSGLAAGVASETLPPNPCRCRAVPFPRCRAVTDAGGFGGVQRIDLRPALAMVLKPHPHRPRDPAGLTRLICGPISRGWRTG